MFTCRNKCKRMRKPSVREWLFSILRVGAWCACLCVCFWALHFWALGLALCSLPFEFYVLRLLFVCVLRFVLKFTFRFRFRFRLSLSLPLCFRLCNGQVHSVFVCPSVCTCACAMRFALCVLRFKFCLYLFGFAFRFRFSFALTFTFTLQ